jgi:hypothetical protein
MILICNQLLTILVDGNRRVYVWDDDVWAVKGRYETALMDDDPVAWDEQGGRLVLRIAAVRHLYYMSNFISNVRIPTG